MFETYRPVMGRVPASRFGTLVDESRATKWFVIYFTTVWTGALTLLGGNPLFYLGRRHGIRWRVIGIVGEMIRTRRLAYGPSLLRLAGDTVVPHSPFSLTRC